MAKSTTATKSAPVATPAPATAPAPVAAAPAVLAYSGKPVTAAALWAWVQANAGGNPANVRIVPLDNVVRTAPRPLPFAAMDKAGKRSSILWALVNGTPGKDGKSDKLDAFKAYAIAHGASGHKLDDLLAAMNGGFSASSKSYGTGFVRLEVVPPAK